MGCWCELAAPPLMMAHAATKSLGALMMNICTHTQRAGRLTGVAREGAPWQASSQQQPVLGGQQGAARTYLPEHLREAQLVDGRHLHHPQRSKATPHSRQSQFRLRCRGWMRRASLDGCSPPTSLM